MMRRKLILTAAFCLAAPLAAPAAGRVGALGQTAARPPNVVIILADDLGYGDLSSFGQTGWRTPEIDRLANEGVRLTDFYAPTPYCAPSRASLLTGRYPYRHGLLQNPAPDAQPGAGTDGIGIAARADLAGLALSEVTLAEALKGAGYVTSMIGKWHLGHQPHFYPRRQGFDEYLGILYSNDMRPVQLMENERAVEYPLVQATLTKRYTERAVDFIERNRARPFFLYLAHAMPHKPLAVSPEFYTPKTRGDLYADVMRELDWSVGEVLNKLRALDLERNTLVIFVSDNGPWFGGSSGGLRGMKGQTWEGGIRVPFLARWPGHIPAGKTSASAAAMIDIFPTVLKAAGVPLPGGRTIDGKDLMPVFASDAPSQHQAIYEISGQELSAVRSGRWKLHVRAPGQAGASRAGPGPWVDPRGPDGVTILAPYEQYQPTSFPGLLTGDPPGEMMLFDLEADRGEQHDVSRVHPDVVARLKSLFDGVAKEMAHLRTVAIR